MGAGSDDFTLDDHFVSSAANKISPAQLEERERQKAIRGILILIIFIFSFSQTEEVWINETCLKAKIKASAWKTIRKTQYDNYEDYFQVFRGFSKKSYPEIYSYLIIINL